MGMLFVSIEWKMKLLTWLCFGFSSTVVAGITLTVSPSNDVEVNQTVTLTCQLDPNPYPPVIVAFANNFTDILCSLEYSNGKCINTSDACLTGYNASFHNETLYSLQVPVSWNWNGLSLYCQNLTSKSNSVLLDVKGFNYIGHRQDVITRELRQTFGDS
uniref:Ig-like domain-containing protein n=1 Tax=Magallana gigas TaxID=29159 RepID=K1PTU2_MAGGI|eukprot:XP_011445100.2 PREDICTED: uncharacterized protein LOC105340627 [Crassostrea gigas]